MEEDSARQARASSLSRRRAYLSTGLPARQAGSRYAVVRRFLEQERGQALPIVLLLLALGAAVIMPALVFANTALIAQRNAKQALVDEYTAECATTYVMWKLLYDTSYLNAPPGTETVTCNGVSVPVTITPLPASSIIDATATYGVTNYTLATNHEIWAIASTADPSGNPKGVTIAYDATGAPSQVQVPFTTGAVTYYFHAPDPNPSCSNPCTDPTLPAPASQSISTAENSAPYTVMRMTTTAPTTTAYYNYDVGHDSLIGRWIDQSNDGAQCAAKVSGGPNFRVVWRSPAAASNLVMNGTVTFRWWWGLENQGFGTTHNITWWLCDFDTTKPFADTGARNPVNLFSPSGKVNASPNIWTRPFDLQTTVGLRKLSSRVDRVSDTAIKVRSYQLSGS